MRSVPPDDIRKLIEAMLERRVLHRDIAEELNIQRSSVAAVAAGFALRNRAKQSTTVIPQDTRNEPLPKDIPAATSITSSLAIPIGFDNIFQQLRYWRPGPESGLANPHMLIIGESGAGKTYATQCLCAEFSTREIPVIVFDFGQGFSLNSTPAEFLSHARPIELHAARDGVAINPLTIFKEDAHGPVNAAQRIADTFARVYPGIGVQQHTVLRDTILETFISSGIDPKNKTTWQLPPPDFASIKDHIELAAADTSNPSRRYASSVASHISTLFVFNTFRPSGLSLDWRSIFLSRGGTFIIQLKGLEYLLERAVTELLLWNLIGFIEDQGPSPLRCVIILDEAHRLSFSSSSPVDQILREGRKFGISVILASQQPEDFSPVAFSNTATKIFFNVSDRRGVVSRYLYQKNDADEAAVLIGRLGKLSRGTAVYLTNEQTSEVKILSFKDRLINWGAKNAN